ncbi:hypothetical protein LMG6000_00420 [Achromobacter insolitus]|uniref:Integrase catalytic domain-containing protein n=2 Tax=Achromobacter insolitus TaxID=217204 RepID=A0A6S7EW43_9BURK|nr:hypothetical protein LMG6000_00420 [Achromobacter insolitus]CAB3944839.1 hypothetical protein LMG5997_05471 [Achromobacter insolitus]
MSTTREHLERFRTIAPHLLDYRRWPVIDPSALSNSGRERHDWFKRGLEVYCIDGNLVEAAIQAHTSQANFLRILRRCICPYFDGKIAGWRALIPHSRIPTSLPQIRTESVKARTGRAVQFSMLLENYPQIEKMLNDEILKLGQGRKVYEARKSYAALTELVRRACIDLGLTDRDYPLNTASFGLKAVTRYAKNLVLSNPSVGVRARYGRDAYQRLKVGTGREPLWVILPTQPYDRIAIDAHRIDCLGTIEVDTPSGPLLVIVRRLWIIVVFDVFSRAALGFSAWIGKEPSAAAVEKALTMSLTTWQPASLPHTGLVLPPNAGFPSGVFPELENTFGAVLTLDNALSHLSARISDKARRRLGCAIAWGACGAWSHNSTLERFYGTLSRVGFQRLPSTTGASPLDPKRDRPELAAVKHRITQQHLQELTEAFIANYNATPHSALAGRSPLQILELYLHGDHAPLFARTLPPATAAVPDLGTSVVTATVRGNLNKGRRPYVELTGARYTGPELCDNFGAIGHKLRVHFRDDDDYREVDAFFESGMPLGKLRVIDTRWARTPHTKWLREQVSKAIASGKIRQDVYDPVEAYLDLLRKQAISDAERAPTKISSSASELSRATEVILRPPPVVSQDESILTTLALSSPTTANSFRLELPGSVSDSIPRPKWTTHG